MSDSIITKKALASSMKSLMGKMPFSKISVGHICTECDLNRKSFYYHFKDKYDLVNWIYYTEFIETIQTQHYQDGWFFLNDICSYFYENRTFYINAFEVSGQNSFQDYFRAVLHPFILNYLKEILTTDENPEFFEVFFTDAFIVAIERWLKENPCRPPDDFIKLLKTSVGSLAKKIISEMNEDHSSP
ncbi:TetR/AcrR family transcriptional regulator C-terminal domain-containing protein [Acetobacterium woodii]|uniref:Transcriptional regulator DhaS n=1 Tax=Acetobacterium woodii (strain ATCC 29683 / DSM 1030 / JCM 2381 / KCTC 1655 / WB1) TaxID=931626 RepID=H6LL02_ACEWD|nr:TetR/AcrR family transcriptional regulator C-terminal domain-containing protein [Acetobacterium woodii]AFA50111.1 transcriptional regulator DhaS [Acetobacterium woodii DSM 1030]